MDEDSLSTQVLGMLDTRKHDCHFNDLSKHPESKKKQMVLSEWEALIAGAGLSDMSSEKIDQAVARKIKRRSDHIDASEATGNR